MSKEVATRDERDAGIIRHGEVRAPEKFGVFDPEFFLHMHRVAEAMAGVSVLPDGLTKTKGGEDGKTVVPLPHNQIVSNCFMVANQAYRWGMDPFAVAMCCSVVHGRLMFEGKLVAAAMESMLNVRLRYVFGKWDGERCIPAEKPEDEGKDDFLAVQVWGLLPGDDEEKMIDGNVGSWKTTGSGTPWGGPQKNRRQLRYRGAREWGRAYAPGVILGVITDDEIDDAIDQARMARATPIATGGRERLQIDRTAGGFDPSRLAETVDAVEADRPKDTKATTASTKSTITDKASAAPKEGDTGVTSLGEIFAQMNDRDREEIIAGAKRMMEDRRNTEENAANQGKLDLAAEEKKADHDPVTGEVKQEGEPAGPGMDPKKLSAYSRALYRTKSGEALFGLSKEYFKSIGETPPEKGTLAHQEMLAVYHLHVGRCAGKITDLEFNQSIVEILGSEGDPK